MVSPGVANMTSDGPGGSFYRPLASPLKTGQARLITQGTKFEACLVLFMLRYFFTMASSLWWLMLTIAWYLAAKCHWAHEAISRNAQYFHLAAWALPAAKTVGLLALGKVRQYDLVSYTFYVVLPQVSNHHFSASMWAKPGSNEPILQSLIKWISLGNKK
ncbi:unnamed protein product [Protopolystoma xenopodis]|uniref:G-protein coupled receptors family 2 profile 2 domain-containing protein n=1 Tax=Protopolystoma xenopodis TaxID=117903 RepID=A0A448XNM0_9PLAT|nr:unnamed protein product [Protopolystoma xenopodis]